MMLVDAVLRHQHMYFLKQARIHASVQALVYGQKVMRYGPNLRSAQVQCRKKFDYGGVDKIDVTTIFGSTSCSLLRDFLLEERK